MAIVTRWELWAVISSVEMLLAFAFCVVSMADADWRRISMLETSRNGTEVPTSPDFQRVEMYLGLLRAQVVKDDMTFEVDFTELRRTAPIPKVAQYDLAGRVAFGLLLCGTGACVLGIVLCLLASMHSTRVSRFTAGITCAIASMIVEAAAVIWSAMIPTRLESPYLVEKDHEESYGYSFYFCIAAGALELLSGIDALLWKGRFFKKVRVETTTASSSSASRSVRYRRLQFSVVPLIAVALAFVAVSGAVTSAAYPDFEEQYFFQPWRRFVPSSKLTSSPLRAPGGEWDSPVAAVAVFAGLIKARVEIGCFAFTTKWSEAKKAAMKMSGDQEAVFDKYERAGIATTWLIATGIVMAFLFGMLCMWMMIIRPTDRKKRIAFVIGWVAVIFFAIAVIVWLSGKPSEPIAFVPGSSSEVTKFAGTSFWLLICSAIAMACSTFFALAWKTEYHFVRDDDDNDNGAEEGTVTEADMFRIDISDDAE